VRTYAGARQKSGGTSWATTSQACVQSYAEVERVGKRDADPGESGALQRDRLAVGGGWVKLVVPAEE
jgi:hypothetical protein